MSRRIASYRSTPPFSAVDHFHETDFRGPFLDFREWLAAVGCCVLIPLAVALCIGLLLVGGAP